MPLVELIRTSFSDESLLYKAEGFITSALGKEVVYAKDNPAFIANRIGVFSFLAVLKHAENYSLSADTVDALTGKRVGRPSSATFRTLDVVGLDVMSNVVKNIFENAKDDPWVELFKLPDWIDNLISIGSLGSKTKKGIYEKVGKDIYVYDPFLDGDFIKKKNCIPIEKEDGLGIADFVSIHLPLNKSTKNFISQTELKLMKKNSVPVSYTHLTLPTKA